MATSLSILLILAVAITANAASLRGSTPAPSKKTAVAAKQETTSFVTTRIERVPRPAKSSKRKTSSRGSPIALRSENAIEHSAPIPSKRKSKQHSSRRWGETTIGSPFGRESIPETFYRHIFSKQNSYAEDTYRGDTGYDSTASVKSPTIAVSPIRYKIIDMGDPWVRWPQSSTYGIDPHRPYPAEDGGDLRGAYRMSPYRDPPIYGYRQRQPYGADESAAYSDVQESYMDPFKQYESRDVLPWSVQVGTSLTVKDDGRQSRRRYYVRSQNERGHDDYNG